MDYSKRLKELNEKLEYEGLTEREKDEILHIHVMTLLELKERNKQLLAKLQDCLENITNFD